MEDSFSTDQWQGGNVSEQEQQMKLVGSSLAMQPGSLKGLGTLVLEHSYSHSFAISDEASYQV